MNRFCPNDLFPDPVSVFFSSRETDFTLDDDECGFTPGQLASACRQLGHRPEIFVHLRQVHGGRVVVYGRGEEETPSPVFEADAVVTRTPDVALTVRTADCVPVFLAHRRQPCVGLAHAGWKGCRLKITERTVQAMCERGDSPAELIAWLGPCIRPCCYTVGEEFLDVFGPQYVRKIDGDLRCDLAAVVRHHLLAGGVLPENIRDSGLCTCCDPRFFSYRRDGRRAGRHLSVITFRRRGV